MVIDGKEMAFHFNGRSFHCALDITMFYIGGKWKSVILWYLRKGPKRFSELKKHIPEITEKMLSLQLKDLEANGLVQRTVFAQVPPRVEYGFTAFGETMLPMLEEMAKWGKEQARDKGEMVEIHR